MPEDKRELLKAYLGAKIGMKNEKSLENVHEITASALSEPDQSLISFGLKDGTVSVWNPISQNLEFNTDRHQGKVTCLAFFEKWKLVSGSSSGEVFIHNVVERRTLMKRTNTF